MVFSTPFKHLLLSSALALGAVSAVLRNLLDNGMVEAGPAVGTVKVTAVAPDTIKLDDAPVLGGKMSAWTVGMNWYWHSNFEVALNQVMVDSSRRGIDDSPNITEMRFQFYW